MTNSTPGVLLVDDHPVFREGLAGLIKKTEPAARISHAADINQARQALESHEMDVAFIDISLKTENGLDLVKIIRDNYPKTMPIVLSMHQEKKYVRQAYDLGAKGYILKDAPMDLLAEIFKNLPHIEQFITHPALMPQEAKGKDVDDSTFAAFASLTSREQEVFTLLARGLNYKEVGYNLKISAKTASVHRYNIQQKLGIFDQRGFIRAALSIGIITAEEVINDFENPSSG